jgi:hypothetical protein
MAKSLDPDHDDPTRSNPSQEPPMEFPRPPNEPGRKDPRATPDPSKPSTRPNSDVEQPTRPGVGNTNAGEPAGRGS